VEIANENELSQVKGSVYAT